MKTLNLKKEEIVIVLVPNITYAADVLTIVDYLSKHYAPVCYINFNRPFMTLTQNLLKKKIDANQFLFVDAVTKAAPKAATATETAAIKNCIFIPSATSLTQLSLTIEKILKTGKINCVLFDSLSTILIYNNVNVAGKCIHDIINKIRAANTTAIFTALEGDEDSPLVKGCSMFVDNIIGGRLEETSVHQTIKVAAKGLKNKAK